jgi:hypothetical protein
MRTMLPAAFSLSMIGALAVVGTADQGRDATPVLAAAREALGGDQALAAVRSFVATGRTRQVRGNNLVPIEFEIACELPSKYVRRDEVPAQESGPTASGFNGEALVQVPPPSEPAAAPSGSRPAGASTASAPSGAPADARKARVASLKQDFVKLTLGMFAASFESYPLAFSLIGRAEAPQGTADIVDVKGPDGLALRLFVNSQTRLPIMVSWTTPATAANVVLTDPGQRPPENLAPGSIVVQAPARPAAGAPKDEQDTYVADVQALRTKTLSGAKPIEHRLYFADYREAGKGLRFPFRLRRSTAGETVEETNFDGFTINARIDPRKFEPVK